MWRVDAAAHWHSDPFRYVVFDDKLASNMMDVLALEAELRRALQRGEFEPYFQSVHRLDDGEVVGYEALMRWRHPRRGVLEPMHFLKVAFETGLIGREDPPDRPAVGEDQPIAFAAGLVLRLVGPADRPGVKRLEAFRVAGDEFIPVEVAVLCHRFAPGL